jgi:hypothetical protein
MPAAPRRRPPAAATRRRRADAGPGPFRAGAATPSTRSPPRPPPIMPAGSWTAARPWSSPPLRRQADRVGPRRQGPLAVPGRRQAPRASACAATRRRTAHAPPTSRWTAVQVGPEALLGPAGGALALIERAVDYANAALCAEAVGIMAALNEVTLEYLKTRKQFGVPIGKFQALQHRMADMVIATEQARSMAILAAVRADSTPMPPSAAAPSPPPRPMSAVGAIGRPAGGATARRHGRHRRTQRRPLLQAPDHDRLTFGDVDYHWDGSATPCWRRDRGGNNQPPRPRLPAIRSPRCRSPDHPTALRRA